MAFRPLIPLAIAASSAASFSSSSSSSASGAALPTIAVVGAEESLRRIPSTTKSKVNLVRVLLARAKADPVAARFVEQHRDGLREMMQRFCARPVEHRHGQGIGWLRSAREEQEEAQAAAQAAEEGEDEEVEQAAQRSPLQA